MHPVFYCVARQLLLILLLSGEFKNKVISQEHEMVNGQCVMTDRHNKDPVCPDRQTVTIKTLCVQTDRQTGTIKTLCVQTINDHVSRQLTTMCSLLVPGEVGTSNKWCIHYTCSTVSVQCLS